MPRMGEIDLTDRVWTIPASRMKAKRDHRVPLCELLQKYKIAVANKTVHHAIYGSGDELWEEGSAS